MHPSVIEGYKYFITFAETDSCYTFTIPLTSKGEVTKTITAALLYSKSVRGEVLLNSDIGKEYLEAATKEAAISFGTLKTQAIPYNPEQNRIAERINRTLMDGARAVLSAANIALAHWMYGVAHVESKHNILMHSNIGWFPLHDWKGRKDTLPLLRVFGQIGSVPNSPVLSKMKARGKIAR